MWSHNMLKSFVPPEPEGLATPTSSARGTSTQDLSSPSPVRHNNETMTPAQQQGMGVGVAGPDRKPSPSSFRAPVRRDIADQDTIRTVTPEPAETFDPLGGTNSSVAGGATQSFPRGFGSISPQSSPRSIPGVGAGVPGGTVRRQGMVFNNTFAESWDSSSSSPPGRPPSFRPRTHTMDSAYRQQLTLQNTHEARHRMGSFSSSGSLPVNEETRGAPALQSSMEFSGSSTGTSSRLPDSQGSSVPREKKHASKHLIKRATSRPTSPVSPPPSVDSLPMPVPTDNANKVLLLMRTLCGRMRGEIEYQDEPDGPWSSGVGYIEEEKGALMFDPGENGSSHVPVIPDLRGCRVFPIDRPGTHARCLEISKISSGYEVMLQPVVADEFDLWLAALLCWQQLKPTIPKSPNERVAVSAPAIRPDMKRRGSTTGVKEASIIKVGKVALWDKGVATTPRAIVKRSSTRDLRSSTVAWRRVSCILQDNGELKLMTENDVGILSVIELSQLSRCAIQQLDKSVLDEEYCIAIFPIYSSTSTQLSIFRPVYISLDTRVLFEVWFVLFRAFSKPDLYAIHLAGDTVVEVDDFESELTGDEFRVEKTLHLRITEAKLRSRTPDPNAFQERNLKNDQQDVLVGNYLAEVILDGEVRARTTTKSDTRNPFWREDCDFMDLPSTLPFLSVVVKRVEGNPESFTHQLQASLGLSRTGNLVEMMYGSVDINLNQLERGKDHENWLQIYDEKEQAIGQMLLKVHHEEYAVLLSKDYQPLSELLHNFSSGLTLQIAEVLHGNLRRLADVFLNIFQVSGSAGEWLMALVEDEIDGIGNQAAMKKSRFSRRLKSNESMDSSSDREAIVRDMSKSLAGEANLLFRGNSLLTQAFEFHMRRLGKDYLEGVLADKISEINEMNPDCEVDPSKVYSNDEVGQHWNQLLKLTTEIWECIANSADQFPVELQHIMKYIRAVADDRYGDFLRTVSYTSISGFLFLRFICPAILNPKLFGLLRDHPRPRAQRTLTLIAKGLQALANLSTIGKKETWMEPMNKFLTAQRQSVKDFIDRICAIPADRNKITVPPSYSTPITILGRLSPGMREGFPSLPYLIDHPRSFAALVKLWMEANSPSNPRSHIFEGDLLEFNDLCMELQERADERYARMESLRVMESASQLTEDPLEALERANLIDTVNISYGNSPSWMDDEAGLRPPGSSGSDVGGNTYMDQRWGREPSAAIAATAATSMRNASGSSELSVPVPPGMSSGTMRSMKNGKSGRKFLSGFIRGKGRTASPEGAAAAAVAAATAGGAGSASGPVRTSKEKERDKGGKSNKSSKNGNSKNDKNSNNSNNSNNNTLQNLPESWNAAQEVHGR